MSNLDRFKQDLDALVKLGAKLELSFLVKAHGKEEVEKALGDNGDVDALKNLPAFGVSYEAWYSEGIAVIKVLLPDRLQDFKDHYEIPKGRKEITNSTYRIQDALKDISISRYGDVIADSKSAVSHFQQQVAILMAARRRFESSLFEIKQLVQADLFDGEIAAARELLKNKFLRAAGAIAGVVLEKHLREVCGAHKISITKKNPGIGDLNELLKSNSVIDIPQWRFISMLADIRNICDHNKQKEPTQEQVSDLVDGADKALKTIF